VPRNDFDDFEDSADFPMNDGEEFKPITFGELGVPGLLVRVLAADGKKTAFPIQADTLPTRWPGATFSAEAVPVPARPSPFRFLWSLVLDPMIRLAKPR